ncbi:MAG: hypothetical protein CMI32_04800 [Opitutales bacterium]|nr:hypothetical protein [Opitutales bacterium]|tara:strand:- start:1027 stop:2274 length:1248 start_codon:yes stop_codon:yes gene_type:complete
MNSFRQNPVLKTVSSLRLTIFLLSCSMVLVFFATLDQVHMGIRGAQKEYFESLYGIWHYPAQWPYGESLTWLKLSIPGGYLVGPLLFLNLVAAHLQRLRLTWKKGGIQCVHLGIILLLLGQLFTQLFQVESKMFINKGEQSNFISRFHEAELAFVNVSDPEKDEVVAIPQTLLEKGGEVRHPDLPFSTHIRGYGANCDFSFKQGKNDAVQGVAASVNRGAGADLSIELEDMEEDMNPDSNNFAWVVVELKTGKTSLGTWLSIAHPNGQNDFWKQGEGLLEPLVFQEFRHNGQLWGLEMRQKREYLPYSIELKELANEYYQGTDIPRNFESDVRIHQKESIGQEGRPALVYMNHPLRHEGKTFYQYQMGQVDDYTVFQVIENPGWLTPYAACLLVFIGLLWQFGYHLTRFLGRKRS